MPDSLVKERARRANWELSRPRLGLTSRHMGCERSVISVCAAAGYGKSTLLSQWRQTLLDDGRRVIPLEATIDDREGDQLLLELAAALNHGTGQGPEAMLDGFGARGRSTLLRALIAEIEASRVEIVVLIDDVHVLAGAPAENLLRQLIRNQPKNLLIILSGRNALPAVTTPILIEGRLSRFSDQDLALSTDEIVDMLRQHNVNPRRELVQALQSRTQGWPAAVRLVALTLESDPGSQDRFVTGLATAPQVLAEYLNDVLFNQLSFQLQAFLLRMSLLRSFDLPLARALSGDKEAGILLDEIQDKALPIRVSDEPEPSYMLHPLLRDFFLARLKRSQIDELSMLQNRALEYLLARGQIERSIEVCLDGGDIPRASALISEHGDAMVVTRGRHSRYLYWVNMLPPEALHQYPDIRLKQAWSLNFLRRFDEAESIRLELESEYLSGDVQSEEMRALERGIDVQRCAAAGLGDRPQASINRAKNWLKRWPDGAPYERAAAYVVQAFAERALGQFSEALAHGQEAQTLARENGDHYILTWASMVVISILIKHGQCRQALAVCDHEIEELAPQLGPEAPAVMMIHAMRAGLLYEFNRLDDARDALERGLTALIEQSAADPIILGYVTLSRLQVVQGDVAAGIATLYEGETQGKARQLPRLSLSLSAERIVCMLRSGELKQARQQWIALQDEFTDPQYAAFGAALQDKSGRIEARIALMEGHYQATLEGLQAPLERAQASSQKRKEVEILLLMAVAHHQLGEQERSAERLRAALAISLHGGYQRTLIDEADLLREPLSQFLAGADARGLKAPTRAYLDQICKAARVEAESNNSGSTSTSTSDDPLVSQNTLTARELEIVTRLRTGPTNRQLSDAMFISPGTLKWHLNNIYSKLGVNNRLAAISRCQELGLIES